MGVGQDWEGGGGLAADWEALESNITQGGGPA